MAHYNTYLYLQPIAWSHKIRRYPSLNVGGSILSVTCTMRGDSDLLLSEGHKLSNFQLELSIFPGELSAEDRKGLPEEAIGGIWWLAEERFVHGWFCLKADEYAAVWDQVRDGGYVACAIDLGVRPVDHTKGEFAWSANPLCIETAAVDFHREAVPKKQAKDATKEKRLTLPKQWAVVLFVMAATGWFFPQWNGAFFEPSKDMTTGEGRIVAAVLFVGGLLLWFLGRNARKS